MGCSFRSARGRPPCHVWFCDALGLYRPYGLPVEISSVRYITAPQPTAFARIACSPFPVKFRLVSIRILARLPRTVCTLASDAAKGTNFQSVYTADSRKSKFAK